MPRRRRTAAERETNRRRREAKREDRRRLSGLTDEQLKAEIRAEHELVIGAGREAVRHALECGEALLVMKYRVKLENSRGWTAWLTRNFKRSLETARVYMRVAKNRWYVEEKILENPDVTLEQIRRAISKPRRRSSGHCRGRVAATSAYPNHPDYRNARNAGQVGMAVLIPLNRLAASPTRI
jgi:hypothetical protein